MKIDFLKHIKTSGRVHPFKIYLSRQEFLKIQVNAMRFADGSISDWIRYAATMLLPPPNHIKFNSVPEEENDLYNKDYGHWEISPEHLEALKKKAARLEEIENANKHKMRRVKQSKARRAERASGGTKKPVKTKLSKAEKRDS